MHIVCLLSVAIHPRSGRIIPSPIDLKVIALADKIANANNGTTIHTIHCVNSAIDYEAEKVLTEYLGYGVKNITIYGEHDNAEKYIDVYATLTAAVRDKQPDLVICGTQALSDLGTGMLPYVLSDKLGYQLHSQIIDIDVTPENADNSEQSEQLELIQYLPSGNRRKIPCPTCSIISVHPKSTLSTPYAYSKTRMGSFDYQQQAIYKDITADTEEAMTVRPRKNQRKRFKLKSTLSAHERMRQATTTSGNKGGRVLCGLNARQGAEEIMQILKQHKLID